MKDIDDIVIDRINKQIKQDDIDTVTNLRDEFAKAALPILLHSYSTETAANYAYEAADAMLKARQL